MIVPVRNKSGASLGIGLEPWCDEIELEPGQEAEVEFKLTDKLDTIEIDVETQNFVSLWVPPGATIKLRS